MQQNDWLSQQADLTLKRLLPRITPVLGDTDESKDFLKRLYQHFPRLFRLLYGLYGNQYDFFYHIEEILLTAANAFVARPTDLKQLDQARTDNRLWFQSEKMVGAVCYVDRFAGDLQGIHAKIPYLQELGVTYLHLMPLFDVPDERNDGGYAIRDYRKVRSDLGTMEDLAELSAALRKEGISLVLDFVFNHTSFEHEWAQRALAGETHYQQFYYMFPDRNEPDEYEATLREIFPEQAPGSFTYLEEAQMWVWTTFYNFQWDLRYSNPALFNAMLGEMLFLANQGVEILRLDAVAFIWKEKGTPSESLPQAHWIIQAYNALTQIAAPAMLFKSEAIVHPRDVLSYIDWNEAPISYNPTLMALLWEALATREVKLLRQSMAVRFFVPDDAAWINYIRVHDDIGWSFADEDGAEVGIKGFDHRQFLNSFYIGEFDGSFAKGIPFGYNPKTKDMRISGTAASLAGLELAIERDDSQQIDYAIRRLLLLHSVIISVTGIPLIYLGDEIATTNDYSYRSDPARADDSRWAHRPLFDWERAEERHDSESIVGRVFGGLTQMLQIRKNNPLFGDGKTTFFESGNPHVLAYLRSGQILILANFSERTQVVPMRALQAYLPTQTVATDLLTEREVPITAEITLPPYRVQWLDFSTSPSS